MLTSVAKLLVAAAIVSMLLAGILAWDAAEAQTVIGNPLGEGATFHSIIQNVVRFANSLLAPLSTLMVLIAGFLYMTGGGNPEKIKTARQVLIWTLVGIAVVIVANVAETIVREVLGIRG